MNRFIDEKTVLKVLTPGIANRLTETGFKNSVPGKVQQPPKVYLNLPLGDFRAMPVYADMEGGLVSVKWVSVFPRNARRHLPVVNGTILLSDAKTGRISTILSANALTAFRTGAAGAVASKYMAVRNPEILALIGSGVQSEYQLKCHVEFFKFNIVRVWGRSLKEAQGFKRRFRSIYPTIEVARDIRECVRDADIISTCTPSRRAILRSRWVKPGAHVNAMGADAEGKRELETRLLKKSRIFVDEWKQASHSGEINVPLSRRELKPKDIRGSITDIIRGKVKARASKNDITVFDSTGLAIQDLMLATYIRKRVHRSR